MKKADYILLVDDDPTTNFLNKIMLERAKVAGKIVCVENGEDAFSVIHEIEAGGGAKPQRLCILLDLNMPVIDGYEFLEELKMSRINLQIEVYVLSILDEIREKKNLASFPIAGYVGKPLKSQEVEKLFCGNRPCYFNKVWE